MSHVDMEGIGFMLAMDQIEKQLACSACPNLLFHRSMELVDLSLDQSVVVELRWQVRRVRTFHKPRKFIVRASPDYSKHNLIAQDRAGRSSRLEWRSSGKRNVTARDGKRK
jgi:hypothetical protein